MGGGELFSWCSAEAAPHALGDARRGHLVLRLRHADDEAPGGDDGLPRAEERDLHGDGALREAPLWRGLALLEEVVAVGLRELLGFLGARGGEDEGGHPV